MRMYPKEFPAGRRKDPKRRAERQVYEALAGSDVQGFVYYEWRKGYERIEVDFAIWVKGLGRFALQAKGGRYALIDGDWRLKTRDGVMGIGTCPLDEAWLGALDLHDDIKERACTPYNPYVVPVLSFPDMTDPDPSIESLARRKGVYVIWGSENLPRDLAEVVRRRSVFDRLSMNRISAEVEAVTDGLIRLDETVGEEGPGVRARSTALSLRAGGLNLIRFNVREMHLRLGPFVGPGVSRKRTENGRR